MRRGRGKGKKQNTAAAKELDHGSGEEEKISPYRRRGRPQKSIKVDDVEEEEEEEESTEEIEQGNTKANGSLTGKDLKSRGVAEIRRKRKRSLQSKENNKDTIKEENGGGSKSNSTDDDSTKSCVGYRPNGSRRKNKPRRAAEAVVECNGV